MKQNVSLSGYSMMLSGLCVAVLVACLLYCRDNWGLYLIGGLIVAAMFLVLFYMPMSVSADENNLCINRSLRIKNIPLSEIKSVELCAPTMAERRICGAGGFFGYWGRFYEPSMGRYFAYYGKASDCFLVKLKNGKKYLLGCQNPAEIVNYIKQRI